MSASVFPALSASALHMPDSRGHLDVLYEVGNLVLKRSFSKQGVFRGMHWQQAPSDQTKLIRVISGAILDFVVDPLTDDKTIYRKAITADDGWICINARFAHGFYAQEDTHFEYICHGAYDPASEASFSITTYLKDHLGLTDVILSAKDAAAAPLAVRDGGLVA